MHIFKLRKKSQIETWMLRFFFSASDRLTRSATIRNLRRGFLTMETAFLHLRKASSLGFLCSTSKSFNRLSILLVTIKPTSETFASMQVKLSERRPIVITGCLVWGKMRGKKIKPVGNRTEGRKEGGKGFRTFADSYF